MSDFETTLRSKVTMKTYINQFAADNAGELQTIKHTQIGYIYIYKLIHGLMKILLFMQVFLST